ncbi:MAG: ATP phosphoribosyltransferase regulatory subunit [Candidatus Porifericomitaceae bacterium WSBS_2022_MAG_OTU9]
MAAKAHGERWLLPEGIDEWLPPNALALEQLRQKLLELYRCHGYELIMPPMLEYVDSLLSGIGVELDLETFKVVDHRSGRMLGLRADITPQSARIDAHRLLNRRANGSFNRLCYLGPVLNATSSSERSVHQTGAELYGHKGIASDAEVLLLMWQTVKQVGINDAVLDLGHVGIFNYLLADSGLDAATAGLVKNAMKRWASDDLEVLLANNKQARPHLEYMQRLLELHGGIEVLDEAAKHFRSNRNLIACVRDLQRLVELCMQNDIDPKLLRVDLAELRGSPYHNGVVFAVYHPGDAKAIAGGGRYDYIGRAFGRSRKATGFSARLESLFLAATDAKPVAERLGAILAPWPGDGALCRKIRKLREQGECVVNRLGVEGKQGNWPQCDRELILGNSGWRVVQRSQKD